MNGKPNSLCTGPDERGHFGIYGGRFVAETLMPLVLDLERAYTQARNDPAFKAEMEGFLSHGYRAVKMDLDGEVDGTSLDVAMNFQGPYVGITIYI